MTTPTNLGPHSGGRIQPPSPKEAPTASQAPEKESPEESLARWAREAEERVSEHVSMYECVPIIGACGCQFIPCHMGGSTVLPFLPEPHFTTMMRNAIKEHPFKHRDQRGEVHRMLGIDPTPQKTADELRSVAHTPWLLQNRYSTLPNRLEVLIRRAIKDEPQLTELDRQLCYRMLAMDDEALAERERLGDCRTCPTCGTPKGYRLDGCSWVLADKERAGPSYVSKSYKSPYAIQDWQMGSRHQRRSGQPNPSSTPPYPPPPPPPPPPPQQLDSIDDLFNGPGLDEDWDFHEE